MKKFYKNNYKGKYFIISDTPDDFYGDIGVITKKEALKQDFIRSHIDACMYYGIPAYLGSDNDMNKAYK